MRLWTDEEWDRLVDLQSQGLNNSECGRALGRNESAIRAKLERGHLYAHEVKLHTIIEADLVTVPPKVREERTHRRSLSARTITASLMGDPLPGYSALDKIAC